MSPRLVDLYPIGTRVEILLGDDQWAPGVVVAHQHQGVWVETMGGRQWFVTNGRRIRQIMVGGGGEDVRR